MVEGEGLLLGYLEYLLLDTGRKDVKIAVVREASFQESVHQSNPFLGKKSEWPFFSPNKYAGNEDDVTPCMRHGCSQLVVHSSADVSQRVDVRGFFYL